MKSAAKKPCNECPFRKEAAPGWLGDWESPEELHRAVMSESSFPCHLTMLDGEEEFVDPADMKLCAGALLYMRKNCKSPRLNPEVVTAFSKIDPEQLPGIMTFPEFSKHHKIK